MGRRRGPRAAIEKLLRRLDNVGVRTKLFLSYGLGFVLPLAAVSVAAGLILTQQARRADESQARAVVAVVRSQVSESLEAVSRLAGVLSNDQFIRTMLDDWRIDELGHLIRYRLQLRHYLDSFVTAYPLVDAIEFYTTNAAIIQGGSVFRLTSDVRGTEWAQRLATEGSRAVAVAHQEDSVLLPRRRLSLVRDMGISTVTGRDIETILRIDLSTATLAEMLRRSTPYGAIRIVGAGGATIASGAAPDAESEGGITVSEALATDGPFASLRIIGVFPYRGTGALSMRLGLLMTVLAFSSIMFASIIQFGIGASLTRRLRLLSEGIRDSRKDHFPPVPGPAGDDELGATIRAYNSMTQTIERLLDEVFEEGLAVNRLAVEKRHAELEALFSKINPHFLSNSLNTIRMKSLSKGEGETADALKALSRLFDHLTAWQDETISVGEELAFISDFLALQRYRFGDGYVYDVRASEDVLALRLPRMLVQPIVENASVHGIEARRRRGRIDVSFTRSAGRLQIAVQDDGIGMDRDVLESQQRRLRGATLTGESIGLQNVYNRLVLAYGEKADLTIESAKGVGTRVTLVLPAEEVTEPCEP